MDSPHMIEALQQASVYPHPAIAVEMLQTHISWVLLTGEYAYKVKKPMDFGFLNFSTLEQRKFFCEEELRLNHRFAPELYLEVVSINDNNGEISIGGKGEIIDYAVKMKQFDVNRTLDKLAAAGELPDTDFAAIGRNLALFHQAIADTPPPRTDFEPQPGTPAAVWHPIEQNFDQIRPLLCHEPDLKVLQQLDQWSTEHFKRLEGLIGERYANGFVRECHGDLHLGNMVKMEDGEVLFFDCIEFNTSFRRIDVACELAFTVMDLEARNMPEAANRVLNTYLEYSGDYQALQLLNFYKVYFAVVRAKVTLLAVASLSPQEIQQQECYATYQKYARLALEYTRPVVTFAAITHGVSGSGKSTVAARIASATGAIRLRSDVERKRLFELGPDEASDKSIYTNEASRKTFEKLATLMQIVSEAGLPCIVDATFLHEKLRGVFKAQAQQLGQPFVILSCEASEEELRRRLDAREQAGNDASEATTAVMLDQVAHQEPLTQSEREDAIVIDTTAPLNLQALVDRLTVSDQTT
ncbi:AAA family ATPase [Pseudomaricurvus alkylphenolicus]|uniref:bifunctional aminoglycoside phosphotransferase/ATP-binding protein n=1 Tax=Pseudomaricurvus alkylphenolicus TaxID=1306991 RepID=UPI001423A44D|nr:bifunctional aminoglycoside phosphotransferase/ATP-binding protein [Pseudomaricurvus alkylphenolicus]NIB41078.1 AAA family ATPase [Pseudomaricurvus alkylphenolicus]